MFATCVEMVYLCIGQSLYFTYHNALIFNYSSTCIRTCEAQTVRYGGYPSTIQLSISQAKDFSLV